jgi:energy-converting hydrogenase A subunit M
MNAKWQDKGLEKRAKEWLDSNYECCKDIVEELTSILSELEVVVDSFSKLRSFSRKVSL